MGLDWIGLDYFYGIELFLPVHRRLIWRVLTRMHASGVREMGEGDGVCGCLNPDPPKEIKSLLIFVDFIFSVFLPYFMQIYIIQYLYVYAG